MNWADFRWKAHGPCSLYCTRKSLFLNLSAVLAYRLRRSTENYWSEMSRSGTDDSWTCQVDRNIHRAVFSHNPLRIHTYSYRPFNLSYWSLNSVSPRGPLMHYPHDRTGIEWCPWCPSPCNNLCVCCGTSEYNRKRKTRASCIRDNRCGYLRNIPNLNERKSQLQKWSM